MATQEHDAFTTAARAEAEKRTIPFPFGRDSADEVHGYFTAGAQWACGHLTRQEVTDAEITAAARKLWELRALNTLTPGYLWENLDPALRQSLYETARAALTAAKEAS